jgi:hypothetical protein
MIEYDEMFKTKIELMVRFNNTERSTGWEEHSVCKLCGAIICSGWENDHYTYHLLAGNLRQK